MKTCGSCAVELVHWKAWRPLTPEQRATARAAGRARSATSNRCMRCYHADRRTPAPDPTAVSVPVEVVVEEWPRLANTRRTQGQNIRSIAPQLGMSTAALERALQRARARGLIDGAA